METRKFNHDIRLEQSDRDFTNQNWGSVSHALVNEPLIQAFAVHEDLARRSKKKVQWLGSLATVLLLTSLLVALCAVSTSVRPAQPFREVVLKLSAAFSVGGLVLAFLASRYGPYRRRWLTNRFIAECLRQWHFGELLDIDAIAASTRSSADRTAYVAERSRRFAAFAEELRGTAGQKMDLLRDAGNAPARRARSNLRTAQPGVPPELLDAYRALRLEHQLEFAVYKLSPDDSTLAGMPLSALRSSTDTLAALSLVGALGVATIELARSMPGTSFLALAFAIVGVGVRTWRDGLALREEERHYLSMRHRFANLKLRWENATTDDAKLAVMEDVEQATVEELRSYLKTHENAQFVL